MSVTVIKHNYQLKNIMLFYRTILGLVLPSFFSQFFPSVKMHNHGYFYKALWLVKRKLNKTNLGHSSNRFVATFARVKKQILQNLTHVFLFLFHWFIRDAKISDQVRAISLSPVFTCLPLPEAKPYRCPKSQWITGWRY